MGTVDQAQAYRARAAQLRAEAAVMTNTPNRILAALLIKQYERLAEELERQAKEAP